MVPSARPAEVCAALLAALEASEGRRRSRKRDQTPDTIGLTVKRDLLKQAVEDDPHPEEFEEWLLHYALSCGFPGIFWRRLRYGESRFRRMAPRSSMNEFKVWLDRGAPSDDAKDEKSPDSPPSS